MKSLTMPHALRKLSTPLAVALVLAGSSAVRAQTTFVVDSSSVQQSGANANVGVTGTFFSTTGTTTNNFTGITFSHPTIDVVATSNGLTIDSSRVYIGTIGGDSISAGAQLPISYNFDFTQNVTAGVTWSLRFSDSINNPGGLVSGSSLIATGSLNTPSGNISGGADYVFTSGVSAGTEFRTFVEFVFVQPFGEFNNAVHFTAANTGFGGQGITIGTSAVPEPSTYAAIAGAAMLGLAIWRRRSAKNSPPVAPFVATS